MRSEKICSLFACYKALWKFQDFIESRLFAVRQMGLSSPSVAAKAERTILKKIPLEECGQVTEENLGIYLQIAA